ncbi:MAG: phosphate-starvation-inducible PsiE family protein [Campylobacterales bacterium]|nr:phosphate-starvation-inducible PsiE family protein [Campylobacterales bacterium]
MKKFIEKYIVVLISGMIFLLTLLSALPFYKAVTYMLEFIVMIEIVRMVIDFIESKRVRLRFVIDIFIIFLIRDVVIQVTQPKINEERILFLLFVIFVFFLFRLMSIYYSPSATPKNID